MRKSRQEAAKTRERIIASAAAEFREHGIAATGLADFMKAAGLTHGGFYRHFRSKDHLVAEACAAAAASTTTRVAASAAHGRKGHGLGAAVAFLKLVDVLAGQIDEARSNEAEKRAVFAASAMIGALTMARVVTKPVLSDTILRSVAKAVSRMCQEA